MKNYIFSLLLVALTGCVFSNKSSNVAENPNCNGPLITIYSTRYCHACSDAIEYVRYHNYCLIVKEVDEYDDAKREVKLVLERAGMEYGQFPVIAIDGGEIRIGYSAQDLQDAIERRNIKKLKEHHVSTK